MSYRDFLKRKSRKTLASTSKSAWERRKAVDRNNEPGPSSRSRTDSPMQGYNGEANERTRSWRVSIPAHILHDSSPEGDEFGHRSLLLSETAPPGSRSLSLPLWGEDLDGKESLLSNRFWSEAPFTEGERCSQLNLIHELTRFIQNSARTVG